jgi:hypothetical protein
MIMARNGQIAPGTGHDHDQHPKCLKVNYGRAGHNGMVPPGGRGYTAAGRHPRRPPAPLPPAVRTLTSSTPRKHRHHGLLKLPALRQTGPEAHALQTGPEAHALQTGTRDPGEERHPARKSGGNDPRSSAIAHTRTCSNCDTRLRRTAPEERPIRLLKVGTRAAGRT